MANILNIHSYKYNTFTWEMSSLNDFVVLGKIGEGAYSIVHKVKRISDGNIYALKKVNIGSKERLR